MLNRVKHNQKTCKNFFKLFSLSLESIWILLAFFCIRWQYKTNNEYFRFCCWYYCSNGIGCIKCTHAQHEIFELLSKISTFAVSIVRLMNVGCLATVNNNNNNKWQTYEKRIGTILNLREPWTILFNPSISSCIIFWVFCASCVCSARFKRTSFIITIITMFHIMMQLFHIGIQDFLDVWGSFFDRKYCSKRFQLHYQRRPKVSQTAIKTFSIWISGKHYHVCDHT